MRLNKLFLLTLFTVVSVSAFAQGAADALTFSRNQYEGTARTMAMGNAFTALGGDIGALSINPASSGVFRYSQFTLSPSIISSTGITDYLGQTTRDTKSSLAVSNFGFVGTFDTGNYSGLLNWNIGIAYNRTNSFNSIMRAGGRTSESSALASMASGLTGINSADLEEDDQYNPYNNSALSWREILGWNTYLLANIPGTSDAYYASTENMDGSGNIYVGGELQQDFYKKVTGGSHEFTLNFGGNVSDIFYFGANLNLTSISYKVDEYYNETAMYPNDFQDGFKNYQSSYWQTTSGAGVNMKFGVILTPFGGFRLGATLTTPTWYSMTDSWQMGMSSQFTNGNGYDKNSPTGVYEYQIVSPMRASIGAAYTFGSIGVISADYEFVDYSTIKMRDNQGRSSEFASDKNYIKSNYGISNIFRIGAEVRPISCLSLRGGYNYYGTPGDNYPDIRYITAGFGFRLGSKTTLDFAYQKRLTTKEDFILYNDYEISAPTGTLSSRGSKWVLTFGLKF
ncbi:MAG: hypothetical protein PHP76_07795 [Bacteroidales bacterium]|nr:hypothetical protein [Bacteroidales bacterium]